ncbi:ATP-dependent helicase [Chromobacterium amazonense]|uniref:DNA 3'-5' helicase n=1 Tax=Chromobacterium amazonense TaxID=1382803 RepID=A0ABU8V691_9NEIS|nr:ATP-dependent helicase [Chromobacterium amazonense]MDQ4540322.1 ATP-dependent helicase [Chromobacterium amazonense]
MDYLKKLNASQLAAAQWDEGPLLVLAGPGSGKTATLTARVARLVEQSCNESFRILCLTFTRKAAAEMRERLLKLVPNAKDRVLLTTFHSFATDILRQHGSHFGLSPDFEILEESERVGLVKSVLEERSDELNKFVSAEKALSAIDFLLRNVTPNAQVPSLLKDAEVGLQLQTLFVQYKELLKQQNCLDYGSILYFCEELLRERPRVSKQLRTVYRFVCVDEFQDTNIAQYRVLRALAPDKDANVFIVGDDDQVIYQWNGASPTRVRELEQHYNLTTIQLPENYRCPPKVVALANALIVHNGERSADKKPLLSMRAGTSADPIELLSFEDDQKEAEGIAECVKARLQSGARPADVVVLARATKLLERVQKALENLSVPSHVQRRKSQFESAPLRFVTSALKLALVRSDDDLASTVTKALSDCVEQDSSEEDLAGFSAQLNGDQLEALGALVADSSSVSRELKQAVLALVKGQYATFIHQTLTYFDSVESESRNSGDEQFAEYTTERAVWQSIIREIGGEEDSYSLSLGQFLQELALANKTPEAPSNSVRCLTIHSSKGLEFLHVYLVGMSEDQLPSFQSKKSGDDSREMQEERRNCFVAITRTIETLTMSYGERYNGWRKSPSRFLFEMGLLRQMDK